MEITDPSGNMWKVVRQVGAWRRKSRVSWAFEVMPFGGLTDGVISAVIGLSGMVVALILVGIALVELSLLIVTWPVALLLRATRATGWRVIVQNTARPVEIEEKTGSVRLRRARFSRTVLQAETMAGAVRLQDAIAEHLRQGGDVLDPVVDQWLEAERGKVVSHEAKPTTNPVTPKTEPE